jgi:phosphoribosyl-dephospho-CoA transferase
MFADGEKMPAGCFIATQRMALVCARSKTESVPSQNQISVRVHHLRS